MDRGRAPKHARLMADVIRTAGDLAIHLEYETLTPLGEEKSAGLRAALSALYEHAAEVGIAPAVVA